MRLAREYEAAEGPDLRGFIAFAATQDLIEAREGEAALESEGLDAVRLMTIHRAKGLEFPVVCVADLGRAAGGARDRLLLGRDGGIGLRLAPIGGGELVSALDWDRLAEIEQAEEAEEERRLFYVAMTRACERLILSGGLDLERLPAPRPGGPPIDWIARALTGGDPLAALEHGRAGLLCRLNAPATVGEVLPALSPAGRVRAGAPSTALPDPPGVLDEPLARPRPTPQRLSYSSLGAYARCGYRFYLERVLRLPRVTPPPRTAEPGEPAPGARPARARLARPPAARGARLRAPRRPRPRGRARARRRVGGRARRGRGRGHPRARGRLRRLAAVRAAGRRAPPAPRGAVRLRARAPRRRPAGQRLPRRRRARARRRRPDRRLQVRPARGRRAGRDRRARLRDPAGRLRARRPARRRPARRGRLLLPRAPRRAGHARVHAPPTSRRSPNASPAWPAACWRPATR